MNTKRHHRGFTLVELMIVIAMIAVLVLVTIVGMKRFIESARETKAVNTMRQVAIANTQFSVENNGDINVAREQTEIEVENRPGRGKVADSFWGRMTPYLFPDIRYSNQDSDQAALAEDLKRRLNGLFSTTDSSKMTGTFQQKTKIYTDGTNLPVPFAFNQNFCPINQYVKTSVVSNPAQTTFMTYGWFRFNETDFSAYYPMPEGSGARADKRVDYFPSKKAAVLFLDGHIEMITPPLPKRRVDIQ